MTAFALFENPLNLIHDLVVFIMGHILSEAVPEKCSRFGSEICVSVIFLYSY